MFNNPIYKCSLYSITSSIEVDPNKTMRENIENAPTTPISTVLVRKTIHPRYFREIVTGKLLPVYTETTFTNTLLKGDVEREIPKSPVFIKVNRVEGHAGEEVYTDLEKATPSEVEEYYIDHGDRGFFDLSLYEVFARGYGIYEKAREKSGAKKARVLSLFRRK